MGKEQYESTVLDDYKFNPVLHIFSFALFGGLVFSIWDFINCGLSQRLKNITGNRLVGCCLTRSVSIFFLPAIIITELLAYKKSPGSKKKVLGNILITSGQSKVSILIVVIVQGFRPVNGFIILKFKNTGSVTGSSLPFL